MSANETINPDPFTQVERVLWFALESYPPFAAMVRPGNRLKFIESGPHPEKAHTLDADRPEVGVMASGGLCAGRPSGTMLMEQRFVIAIGTGDERIGKAANKVKWHVFRALERVITRRQFGGLAWLVDIAFESTDEQMRQSTERMPEGWEIVTAVRVRMALNRAEVVA